MSKIINNLKNINDLLTINQPNYYHINYHKDDLTFSNDLSFMTDEDWKKYDEARLKKERGL